jgi:hypothetical protein
VHLEKINTGKNTFVPKFALFHCDIIKKLGIFKNNKVLNYLSTAQEEGNL